MLAYRARTDRRAAARVRDDPTTRPVRVLTILNGRFPPPLRTFHGIAAHSVMLAAVTGLAILGAVTFLALFTVLLVVRSR